MLTFLWIHLILFKNTRTLKFRESMPNQCSPSGGDVWRSEEDHGGEDPVLPIKNWLWEFPDLGVWQIGRFGSLSRTKEQTDAERRRYTRSVRTDIRIDLINIFYQPYMWRCVCATAFNQNAVDFGARRSNNVPLNLSQGLCSVLVR